MLSCDRTHPEPSHRYGSRVLSTGFGEGEASAPPVPAVAGMRGITATQLAHSPGLLCLVCAPNVPLRVRKERNSRSLLLHGSGPDRSPAR
jgi:hypothetical protein